MKHQARIKNAVKYIVLHKKIIFQLFPVAVKTDDLIGHNWLLYPGFNLQYC